MFKAILTPKGNVRYDTGSGSITTAAYTEISSSLPAAAAAIEIFNSTGRVLILATGAAASETDTDYRIPPGGTTGLIPLNLAKGVRVALKAVDADATSGMVLMNLFG